MRKSRAPEVERATLRHEIWKITVLPYLLFLLLPLAALLGGTNLGMIAASLRQTAVRQAISLSTVTSLICLALTILVGSPVAYYLARRRGRWHRVVDALVDLPTVLPPAVAGVALLMAFGRNGLLGGWLGSVGIALPFTTAAVVLAQMFVAAPLYIKSAALGFGAVDDELRNAAAMDGASRWQIFWNIHVPLAGVSLISGGVMTWARALGEFGATIIFAGNFPGRTQTMPLAIYLGFEMDFSIALVLSTILILLSFLAILSVKLLLYHTLAAADDRSKQSNDHPTQTEKF